jgi:DNA repair protein RadA
MTETDVDLADLPGVGAKTAEKLRDAGYGSIMAIATMDASKLQETADIGEKTATSIIQAAREELDIGFETGAEKMDARENIRRISTGSEEVDELLGGGVESNCITEFYGEFGSAKTQMSLQLAVNAQIPPEAKHGVSHKDADASEDTENDDDEADESDDTVTDGEIEPLDDGVIFIDTEDTFIPERVKQMAEAKGLDPEKVLNNIYVARAYNSDHQILLGEKAQDIASENDIGLIVVDSLTAQFRSDYVGRGQLADRQQKLNQHMHTLQRLANTYDAAVVVTNQVMANPGQLFGDPTTAIGGHIISHNSAFRIYLRKSKKDKRIARLVDCPYLPEGEAVFKVEETGIIDA